MRIFVDSADHKQIEQWLQQGVVDGVTTNPSIMFKDGVVDLEDGARKLAALLCERPLSVEVTSNDREIMLQQARKFATWARNIVVKIPIINEYGESCLGVIHQLSQEGIAINATALLSFNQALLAAKAGATYVSIFAGRVADEGNDPAVVIHNVRRWLDDWSFSARIIVGSIRTVMDIQNYGGTVVMCAPASAAFWMSMTVRMLPTMMRAENDQSSSQRRTLWMTTAGSLPSSATRPANMLTYVAPAFAASSAWLKERSAVALIAMPSCESWCMTPRQDSPYSLMIGILTTMLRAQVANLRACCSMISRSFEVTSTLRGRSHNRAASFRAPSSRSATPSLNIMLGFVVTPSTTPC